jgi:hypothetical protein
LVYKNKYFSKKKLFFNLNNEKKKTEISSHHLIKVFDDNMYVVTMNIKDSNSPQKIKIINVLEGTTAEVITRSNSLG